MKITNRRANVYKQLSDEGKLIQGLLWSYKEKRLGLRSSIGEEKVAYLLNDSDFKARVTKIRKELKIPRLKRDEDIVEVEIGNSIEAESEWLNSQPRGIYERFRQEIITLISVFNLSLNFDSWLYGYILYRITTSTPSFDWSLAHYVINNLDKIEEIPLTASEKQYILDLFNQVCASNPKITPQQSRRLRIELKQALSHSKRNTARRSRTLHTALETRKIGKKVKYYEPDLGKTITRKVTSLSLATELFDDGEEKKSHTLRKQKQRLLKRKANLLKRK